MEHFRCAFMEWSRSNESNDVLDDDPEDDGRSISSSSSSLFSGIEFESSDEEEDVNDHVATTSLFSDEDWFSDDDLEAFGIGPKIQAAASARHVDTIRPRMSNPSMIGEPVEVVLSPPRRNVQQHPRPERQSDDLSHARRMLFEADDFDDVDLELEFDPAEQSADLDDDITVPSSFDGPGRPSRLPPPPIPTKKLRDNNLERYAKCIHCWGHGFKTTLLTVALAWAASVLSVLARQTVDFLELVNPMHISALYLPVERVGLLRMELCYNETFDSQLSGCRTIQLDDSNSNDLMMTLARLCLVSSVVCGCFFTLFLTASICWESIRMRPIGFGLLVTYFLQSFTMLSFDSNVCIAHHCWIGRGCYMSAAASMCWLGACIGAAKMDGQKWKQRRKRRRHFHQLAKDANKIPMAGKDGLKVLNMTTRTTTLSDTSSSNGNLDDLDQLCML